MVGPTNARNNFVDVYKECVRLSEYEELSAKRHVATIDLSLPLGASFREWSYQLLAGVSHLFHPHPSTLSTDGVVPERNLVTLLPSVSNTILPPPFAGVYVR